MIGGMCTGKSDVFTLGVVLYEMIAGERPYGQAAGPASALMTMLGTTPVSLIERAGVPLALDRIVMRTVQHDPELRPDIFELDEELARILDDTFDDSEAAFGVEDGPTWIEPQKPVRITPLRVSNPTRAPETVPHARPLNATMLGTGPTITPARGVPISPRTPAKPSAFAVGSRTQIPPLSPTTPAIAPLNVRFVQPSTPPPPQRLPQGTKPIENDTQASAWKRQARDAFIRGVVYALLIVIVATTIYLLY
jgi:serine/threonine protein kinase